MAKELEFSCLFETVPAEKSSLSIFKQGNKSSDASDGFTIINNSDIANDEYMLTIEATKEKEQNVEDQKSQDAEFVVVVDKSGSMQGTPWRQVQEALIRMLHITHADAKINVKAMAYNHCATYLDITGDVEIDSKNVQEIRSGGSTNFVAVFDKLRQTFTSKDHDSSKALFIFFMTDGQDTCNNEQEIMVAKEKLQTVLEETNTNAIVHVLGFSDNHDEQFLESLTYLGVQDGTYSFVSPKEGDRALEETILALIKSVSSFVGKNVSLEIVGDNIEFLGDKIGETKTHITLPAVMTQQNNGQVKISTRKLVRLTNQSEPKFDLILHSDQGEGKPVHVKQSKVVVLEDEKDIINHNLIKLRTAVNQLMKDNEAADDDQEKIKKEYEAIEASFKKLKIDEIADSSIKKRSNTIALGLKLLKDIYDPDVHFYNEAERGMKKKGRYGQFQMMSRQKCNIAQSTSSKSEQVKSSNAWYQPRKTQRKGKSMSNADLSCSDSGSDEEMQQQQPEKAKKLTKKLFKKK